MHGSSHPFYLALFYLSAKGCSLSSHFELTLRIPFSIHFLIPPTRTFFFSDLAAYNFFLFVQPLACLPSCLRPSGLVCSASLNDFYFYFLLAYTFVLSRDTIRSVTSCCDINIFNNIPDRRLHCRQPHRIPEGTYDKHLVP